MTRKIEWDGTWKLIRKSGPIYAAPCYRRRLVLCKHCKSYLVVVAQKTLGGDWRWELTRQAPPNEAHYGYEQLCCDREDYFRDAKRAAEQAAERMVSGVD